jgi:cytochrome c oxidase subunit 4
MKQTHIPTTRRYMLTWASLMVLLLITLGSAYLKLGAGNLIANMSISVLMTLLIMAVFMHLRQDSPVVRLVAAAGFFWLMLMFTLTLSDYLTR